MIYGTTFALFCYRSLLLLDSRLYRSEATVRRYSYSLLRTETSATAKKGMEVKYTDEPEVKALKLIHTELKNPVGKSQKPSVQNLQRLGLRSAHQLPEFL